MKNKITIITKCSVAAIGLCLAGAALAENVSPNKGGDAALSAKDKRFVNEAAKGGMMEVAGGKMAAQKGQNPDVKKFGNRMVTDHSKANNELKTIASSKGLKLHAAAAPEKWKSDKDYMDMMVKDHEKDLSEFQAEASGGSDADLKKFASKTSKVIEKHLQMAKEIQSKLK
jgi:putative membrane protein